MLNSKQEFGLNHRTFQFGQVLKREGVYVSTARNGFTLVEIMMVVGIIGLLSIIAMPAFNKARKVSQKASCVNNLRIMSNAKDQSSMANMWATGRAIVSGTDDETYILTYIKGNVIPSCPTSGTYAWRPIGTDPVCSLSAIGHALAN
jgi:prepilin-type N-terminal cleavage/methylation domain-containing protein